MTVASDKQDAKMADAHAKTDAAKAAAAKPVVKSIEAPLPTGALPNDFPSRAILADQGILTYKDLSRFAPDYRITGIDADTAKAIDAEMNKPPLTGVAARFCLSRDTVVDAVAVKVENVAQGSYHFDIYVAGGQVFRCARETSGVPYQPGEFVLVT